MADRASAHEGRSLTGSMVKAAGEIHDQLRQWMVSEVALGRLQEVLPGHSLEEALVKTATVNGLYGTNVYALVRMADHIARVMRDLQPKDRSEDLVERLSAIKALPGDRPRRHTSFASKYAHFFIDGGTFPIYDSLAIDMVRWHLPREDLHHDSGRPYIAFCENLRRLRVRYDLQQDHNSLDRYLGLAGQYRQWRKQGEGWRGNAELRLQFRTPSGATKALLKELCPDLAE